MPRAMPIGVPPVVGKCLQGAGSGVGGDKEVGPVAGREQHLSTWDG